LSGIRQWWGIIHRAPQEAVMLLAVFYSAASTAIVSPWNTMTMEEVSSSRLYPATDVAIRRWAGGPWKE
jgi:hypothetical protein